MSDYDKHLIALEERIGDGGKDGDGDGDGE